LEGLTYTPACAEDEQSGPARPDPLVRALGWRAMVLQADPTATDRWRYLRRHLARGPLRTLEAGSGNGFASLYAASLGNDVTAVSFSAEEQHNAARRAALTGLTRTRFLVGDLRHLSEASDELGRFDQVICFETIEHILDDEHLVRDVASVMRAGARLILTTPRSDRAPLYREVVSEVEDGSHVRRGYTEEGLRELLASAGIDVVDQERISGVVAQLLTRWMVRLDEVYPHLGWLLTLPLRLLQPFDRLLTRLVGYRYLCIAVVGVRR